MANIKAYTDIEQSKKLAEILPLESADMFWYLATKGNPKAMFNEGYNEYGDFELPCWSLASLLSVLPDNYIDDNDTIKHPSLIKTKDSRYMVIYSASLYTSLCNDPVDACVTMIEKLYKLTLL